jgi:hypothetical protein
VSGKQQWIVTASGGIAWPEGEVWEHQSSGEAGAIAQHHHPGFPPRHNSSRTALRAVFPHYSQIISPFLPSDFPTRSPAAFVMMNQ